MSEQTGNGQPSTPGNRQGSHGHNNRRHNPRRRPHGPNNQEQAANKTPSDRPAAQQANRDAAPRREGQQPQGQNNNRRRHNRNHHNRNKTHPNERTQPGVSRENQPVNIERIYEKYLNLLDQHLIARRKFHDLFFRADPAQKNKLERNFYNTMTEVREFLNRLAPEAKLAFEKRNNGLKQDLIYTKNHELSEVIEGEVQVVEGEDPHLLESQRRVSYASDTEESVGTAEDYLKYKNLI